jgi:hypothetical protein
LRAAIAQLLVQLWRAGAIFWECARPALKPVTYLDTVTACMLDDETPPEQLRCLVDILPTMVASLDPDDAAATKMTVESLTLVRAFVRPRAELTPHAEQVDRAGLVGAAWLAALKIVETQVRSSPHVDQSLCLCV